MEGGTDVQWDMNDKSATPSELSAQTQTQTEYKCNKKITSTLMVCNAIGERGVVILYEAVVSVCVCVSICICLIGWSLLINTSSTSELLFL